MTCLVDSHCHLHMLDLTAFDHSMATVVANAEQHGVQHILCVSVSAADAPIVSGIAEKFPHVFASVGVHPSEKSDSEISVEQLVKLAELPKVVAVGETGLDYHYNDSGLDVMRERFRRHIRAAIQVGKPVIVHSRAAQQDTIAIMQEENISRAGGVMHCFTESWQLAEAALELGMYISFSGIVTFKNAQQVADVAARVPLDRLLIETDAPYLTPVPFRGKPNAPEYVRFTAEKLATLHGVSFEEMAKQTTDNYFRLFAGAA